MKKNGLLNGLIVLVAVAGTTLSASGIYAAEVAPATKATTSPIQDVALSAKGVLKGNVVDHQGRPMADQDVVVKQGRREIARAKTDAKGQFEVAGLQGGVYDVTSDKGTRTYRVWTSETAPKKAREQALVVGGNRVARAQFEGLGGLGSAGTLGAVGAVSGIVGGTVGIVESQNAQDDAEDAQKQNAALQEQIEDLQQSLADLM